MPSCKDHFPPEISLSLLSQQSLAAQPCLNVFRLFSGQCISAYFTVIGFNACVSTYTLQMSPRIVSKVGAENVNKFYYYLSKDVFFEYDSTYV